MRNDYMTALTDLNAPVSFGGGGRSGGGRAGDNPRSRYNEDKEAGPRSQTVNREGKGNLQTQTVNREGKGSLPANCSYGTVTNTKTATGTTGYNLGVVNSQVTITSSSTYTSQPGYHCW